MLISTWLSSLQSKLRGRSRTATRRMRKAAASQHVALESLEDRVVLAATFAPAVNYPTGNGAFAVQSADLGNDGKLDLVVANPGANTVSILKANGDGTFQPAVNYSVGTAPNSIVVADFDGDNILDVATGNYGSKNVSLLRGNSNGTFQPVVNFALPTSTTNPAPPAGVDNPTSLATGDFNLDGKPDLAVTYNVTYSQKVSVLINDGAGGFLPTTEWSTGHSRMTRVLVDDFNGDSNPDLIISTQIYGFFSETLSVVVLPGNGNGTFGAPIDTPLSASQQQQNYPIGMALGDFNGDGKMDVVTARYAFNKATVLLGNGDGTFGTQFTYDTGVTPIGVAVGDFDQDGKKDLAFTDNGDNRVSLLRGNGDGTFQPRTTLGVGTNPVGVVARDFNGDSRIDLAVANNTSGTVSVLLNTTPYVSATNDTAGTQEDVAATIDVLANDNVISGRTLAISSVSTPNFGTAVVDGRGTSTTSDDRIVYTPSLNDSGTATFQYSITDGLGNTATANVTVNVTPVNDAPVVDLNGQDETGIDFTTIFVGSATLLSDADALLRDVDGGVIGPATALNGDIFVVNIEGGVTKIDPNTGAQTRISSGALILSARGLAIDDATGNIYVADAGRRAVVKVDRNTGVETIVASGFGGMWGIAVEADGKVLVIDNSARSVVRVDPATGAKTTVKSGLYAPYGVEVASDGTILVADGRYLRKINPTNGAMTSTALLGFWSYDIAEDANGALIVTDYTRIRRVNFATNSSTIVAPDVRSYFLAVGADNDIVASSYGNWNVQVVDGSTGTRSILTSGGILGAAMGVDIDGGVVYGDNIASLTVSITNLLDGASEVLTADVSGTAITASYNSATGVLSLTGDDTAANYQAVLSTITYNNTATNPTSTARVISFVANDGLDSSQPAAFATVVLNRPPVINDQSFSLNENLTSIGSVVATDPDTGDTLTYSIGGGLDAAKFEINSSTGALTFRSAPDYENPTDDGGNNVYDVIVTVTDGKGGSDTGNMAVTITNVTATISGTVFVDADGDGLFDGGSETGINGVRVELHNSDGNTLLDFNVTEMGGVYAFTVEDELGTYRIREIQPTGVTDGAAILGSAAVDSVFSSNEMQLTLAGLNVSDYDFTEVGSSVQAGDTATIGFWQNKNGQALIKQGGSALVTWLNANFGNVFGNTFTDGSGGDNDVEVASFYKNQFFHQKLKGTPKVDAQFMATAFATFFTSSNLSGGSVAASYGFNVTQTGIGTKVVNIGSNGAAFGVADNTDMTIMAILLATNGLTGNSGSGYRNIYDTDGDGVLDDNEKALRVLANNIYSAINEGGHI